VKLLKGMPIIARKTTDKLDIMNNETFTILDINDKTFKIKVNQTPIEIDIKNFSDLFYIAFCMTIHKSQGQTFNHDYTIYEWERLDKRLKYVALSRATDKKYIHLN
jgi:ATP-dependent exoDNAse (exonuclease V) alpha subunit